MDTKSLQTFLNIVLKLNLATDGIFGNGTKAALIKFQSQAGLKQTGELDDKTTAKIVAIINSNKPENHDIPFETTKEQFTLAMKTLPDYSDKWFDAIMEAMKKYGITSKIEACMFMAQIGHETGSLRVTAENLNYSATRLAQVWPNRYATTINGVSTPNSLALKIGGNPRLVGCYTYANRLGNGDPDSGDGWTYRGQGLIQITGKTNIGNTGKAIGVDLIANPTLLQEPPVGAEAAAYFWQNCGAPKWAAIGDFDHVSDLINLGKVTDKVGDTIGYVDRYTRYTDALVIYS